MNLKVKIDRKKFTTEEDKRLQSLIDKYGYDWKKIKSKFPDRNIRQLKERWCDHLNPELNNEPFTEAEDRMLFDKVDQFGKKWKMISEYFCNRTGQMLKNRYNKLCRHIKKQTGNLDQPDMSHSNGSIQFNSKATVHSEINDKCEQVFNLDDLKEYDEFDEFDEFDDIFGHLYLK